MKTLAKTERSLNKNFHTETDKNKSLRHVVFGEFTGQQAKYRREVGEKFYRGGLSEQSKAHTLNRAMIVARC